MTKEEFKVMHSTLIENYQYIEYRLRGIYSKLKGGDFYNNLLDVEKDTLKVLLNEIKKHEKNLDKSLMNDKLYSQIECIRDRRNFWCHACYWKIPFSLKGNVKKNEHVMLLLNDLREAENIHKELYNIFLNL